MKRLQLLLLFVTFCTPAIYAQHLEYAWAKKAGGSATENARSVTTDGAGNIIIAGTFISSSVSFGNVTLTKADSLTSAMFVAKYDSDGNILWAKQAVTPPVSFSTTGNSVVTDADGNIYVCGDLMGDTVTFNETKFVLPAPYGNASYLVKYNADGGLVWVKLALNGRGAMATAIDSDGNLYITGITNNLVEFDGAVYRIGAGGVFVAKYSNAGDFLWANLSTVSTATYGFSSEWMSYDVRTDNDNSVYITGWCGTDTMFFDAAKTVYATNNASLRNLFLVKFDAAGNALWAKGASRAISPGIASAIEGYSIRTAGNHIYLAGTLVGDSIYFENFEMKTKGGYADFFVAEFTKSGDVVWAKVIGSNSVEYGENCLATDKSGNVYMGGITNGDTIHINTVTIDTIIGGNNAMVFKFDANGNFLQLKNPLNLPFYGISTCSGVTVDIDENILITGYFSSGVAFGNDTLVSQNSLNDIFIAKLEHNSMVKATLMEFDGEQVLMFPNPANKTLRLELKELQPGGLNIEIFSITGAKVQTIRTKEIQPEINVSGLENGIYLLTVKAGDFIAKKKLIIQK